MMTVCKKVGMMITGWWPISDTNHTMMNISSFILKILELLQAASFHPKNLPLKQDRSPGPYHKLWHSWLASTSIWRRIPLELGSSAEDERLGSMPSLEVWLVQIIFLYSKWVVCRLQIPCFSSRVYELPERNSIFCWKSMAGVDENRPIFRGEMFVSGSVGGW